MTAPHAAGVIGRVLGDFTVRERLAAGGGGAVHRAEQRGLERDAVVKLLDAGGDPALVERALHEARLASRLDHPYAAHVYAFGAEPDGLVWIAMEHVRGTSLAEVLAAQPRRRLPAVRFVPLLEAICEVVHAAHDQGIVHRDLKPSNILVLSRGGRMLPKLVDLGIATLAGTGAPAGGVVGSPRYMAPELWRDPAAADARSDIYALGVVAFEALTGAPPFTGELGELARHHLRALPPPLPDDLPGELAAALGGALAKQPTERPATAPAFAAAVRAAAGIRLAGEQLPVDPALRREAAWLPQPIADAVAGFEAAHNPHQARDALRTTVHAIAQYVAILALAARSRGGAGPGDPPAATALLRELHDRELTAAEWLALARALVAPWAAARDGYPVPELVDVLCSVSGTKELDALLDVDDGPASEAALRERLAELAPVLVQAIRGLAFLTDYPLVVARDGGGELWMGPRRPRRPWIAIAGEVAPGAVIVADLDGRPLLQLAPLIRVAAPAPGRAEEMFVLAGGRRDRAARLVALPHGFELGDAALWDWFRAQHLAVDDAAAAPVEQAPYRGLRAFTAADAALFFGRERAAEALVNQLLVQPMVAVVGPSGTGKSSFVQAGVVPRLPAGWRAIVLRPGAAPLAALSRQLDRAEAATTAAPGALADRLRAAAGDGTLVVVVDQFEELFTLCHDPAERAGFAEALAGAARSVDDPVRVAITLRDDFLVRAGELAALGDRLPLGLTLLATPAPDDLLRAVIEPARRVGYRFEDDELPAAMVHAVAGRPGALALLSFTAARLWELRDRHFQRLTRGAYDAIGGVEGALAGHAEETLLACSVDQQRLVRELLRRLVTPEGTRAVIDRSELIAALGAPAAAVIERLVAARLLVATERDTGAQQIELIHEALLTSWPRFAAWRRESVETARLCDQLHGAAKNWHDRGRPRGLLWRGEALDELRRWRPRLAGALAAVDLAFASASMADEARGRRLRRTLASTAIAAALAGIAALGVMYRASRRSEAAAQARLIASYVEHGRRLLLDGDYLRALPYLAEAYAQGEQSTAERVLLARAERLAGAELAVFRHAGRARAAALRGTTVLSVGEAGDAALWSATTGRVIRTLPAPAGGPFYGKVSRDGAFAVLPSPSGAIVWDGDQAHTIATAAGPVRRVAIDAAGLRVAIATARELSASTPWGEPLWATPVGAIEQLAWISDDSVAALDRDRRLRIASPRGAIEVPTAGPVELIATGGERVATVSGSRVELWDAGGAARGAIAGDGITAVALDREARRVALGGRSGVVRIVDAATGALLAELAGHRGPVFSLAFSDDATRLASAGTDLVLRIWDVAARRAIATLTGARDQYQHGDVLRFDRGNDRVVAPTIDGAVRVFVIGDPDVATSIDAGDAIDSVQFVAGGGELATSTGRAVTTWSTATGGRRAAMALAGGLARLSPDGSRAVVALADRPGAEIHDFATGAPRATLPAASRVQWAEFDSAGERVVTAADDGTIELWSPRGDRLAALRGHPGGAVMARFAPDDRRIVSAGSDGAARVWDVSSTSLIGRVTGADVMASAELGKRWLVTGNADRVARLWDPATLVLRGTFEHASQLRFATASDDGALAAGATSDGTVSVWDVMSSALIAEFHHAASAEAVAFAPAGDRLLSGGADHRAIVWRLDRETRSPAAVTAFVRCHTPYRLVDTRLEIAAPDCGGR